DGLVRAARDTRAPLIVVNSPNNPTGTPLPEGAVERLLAETAALIVLDEAYQDFGGPTAVPLLKDEPRLVALRTCSKAMSRAGLGKCSAGWWKSTASWSATCPGPPVWRAVCGSPLAPMKTWTRWCAPCRRFSYEPQRRGEAEDEGDRGARAARPRRGGTRGAGDGHRLLRSHA